MMKYGTFSILGALVGAAALWFAPSSAQACGGLFCNASQPVNQAAERILFHDNGDGTTTAIIQIMYQGPAEQFSWVLPISSVPEQQDVGVSSDVVFDRLQRVTNPQYTLNTIVEGECSGETPRVSSGTPTDSAPAPNGGDGSAADAGVSVVAEGSAGPFDWQVIEVDSTLPEPVDSATMWLEDNGYDVGALGPELMADYLAQDMFLMGFKLQKGASAGSIRPVVLTYDGDAGIPIKLTRVAANDDMGVMVWVLGDDRAVPANYKALELNDAKINWFNANSNYNEVVTAAADEAEGQGFVTEYAGAPDIAAERIWSSGEQQQWQNFSSGIGTFSSAFDMFRQAVDLWGSYDGFRDAVRSEGAVTLPADATLDDVLLCPDCYEAELEVAPSVLLAALEEHVVAPMREAQQLVDGAPYMTRLYTTMSAPEMTRDPWFTFNADLQDVDNQHTADRIIECSPEVTRSEAPWRIELPSGHVIRGEGGTAGTWPLSEEQDAAQPAARLILKVSASGEGEVTTDNDAMIASLLDAHNATVPGPGGSCGCSVPGQDGTGQGGWLWVAALGAVFLWRASARARG